MIRDIFIHGAAGRRFGRRFRLDVASPREAVRALIMLRPGLRDVLRNGMWRVIVGRPHIANGVAADALSMRMGSQPLHLVPVTRPRGGGSGKSIGAIIIGVVIVAAAILLSIPTGGGSLALGSTYLVGSAAAGGITYGTVALFGAGLILSGVAGLLQQQMSVDPTTLASASDAPSFIFNGVKNNTQPGGPVPLCYGTFLAGTVVVGTALQVTDIPLWYT